MTEIAKLQKNYRKLGMPCPGKGGADRITFIF